MGASDEESRARQHPANFLVFLASSESHWFTINGDATHDFSLCRRLGFYHDDRVDQKAKPGAKGGVSLEGGQAESPTRGGASPNPSAMGGCKSLVEGLGF